MYLLTTRKLAGSIPYRKGFITPIGSVEAKYRNSLCRAAKWQVKVATA